MNTQFPFAFDMGALNDAFKDTGFAKVMPFFDMAAMQDAQQKNFAALTEANKTALAGYQAVMKRQQALFEGALADAKTRMADMQGQPATTETAMANFEAMKSAFDQALADLKEISDMAQTANTEALEIIKARGEEAMAELKAAADKVLN
ncbi:MAG: phasin family protein [Pseudomonadota bacterium]